MSCIAAETNHLHSYIGNYQKTDEKNPQALLSITNMLLHGAAEAALGSIKAFSVFTLWFNKKKKEKKNSWHRI